MKKSGLLMLWMLIALLTLFSSACEIKPSPTPTATTVYSLYQLEYRLTAHYPDIFW